MLKHARAALCLALVMACSAPSSTESTGGGSKKSYDVYFRITGTNFDPTGGNMRVKVTYYANGVGASNTSIAALPWQSSTVSGVPSGGNATIQGSLTSSYNCNNATVSVSIMANGAAVKSGTFACGADFSLHETLP